MSFHSPWKALGSRWLRELRVGDTATALTQESIWLRKRSPVLFVVAAMTLTMTWCVTSGLPHQFCLMSENNRGSILFHLLVPGGR